MLDPEVNQALVIISTVMMLVGAYPYLIDTLSGHTKPNRVSWFMWALAPSISAGAAISVGADFDSLIRVIIGGFVPMVIFVASFVNRQSYWRLTRFDLGCGLLSFLALIFWGLVDSPSVAILFAATGNTLASVPTFLKAWRYPETETRITYVTSFLSVAIILPVIPDWNIENAAFQTMLLLSTGLLLFAVFRKQIGIGVTVQGQK